MSSAAATPVLDEDLRDESPAGTTEPVTGVRLYTRAPVTPTWLRQAVVPAARALREDRAAGPVLLRRGWLNGPHVELSTLGAPRPGSAHRRSGATPDWARVTALLDAGPADVPGAMADDEYLDRARELGRLERVPPPYLPLHPHGHVELVRADLDGLGARPGGTTWPEPLASVRRAVQAVLSGATLHSVESLAAHPAQDVRHVTRVLLALGDVHPAGLANGSVSFRSHAEAFLSWSAPRVDVRPVFEARRQTQLSWLRPAVEDVLSHGDAAQACAWTVPLARAAGLLDATVITGVLDLARLDGLAPGHDRATMGPPGGDGRVTTGPSDFHRAVSAAGVEEQASDFFAAYRVLVNLTYEQLTLLSVSAMQRYYLCFAVAQTVDDVLGTTWSERLR